MESPTDMIKEETTKQARYCFQYFDEACDVGVENENGERVRKRKRPGRKPNPPSQQERREQNRVAQRNFREREQQRRQEREKQWKEYMEELTILRQRLAIAEYEGNYLRGLVLQLLLTSIAQRGNVPQVWVDTRQYPIPHPTMVPTPPSGLEELLQLPTMLQLVLDDRTHTIMDVRKALETADGASSSCPLVRRAHHARHRQQQYYHHQQEHTRSTGIPMIPLPSATTPCQFKSIQELLSSEIVSLNTSSQDIRRTFPVCMPNQLASSSTIPPSSSSSSSLSSSSSSSSSSISPASITPIPPTSSSSTSISSLPSGTQQQRKLSSGSSLSATSASSSIKSSTKDKRNEATSSDHDFSHNRVVKVNHHLSSPPLPVPSTFPSASLPDSVTDKHIPQNVSPPITATGSEFRNTASSPLPQAAVGTSPIAAAVAFTPSPVSTVTSLKRAKSVKGIISEPPTLKRPEDLSHMPPMQALHILRMQLKIASVIGEKCPYALTPTALQRVIPHDVRIDYVPSGTIRDRMILFQDFFDMDDCFHLLCSHSMFVGGDIRDSRNWVLDPIVTEKYWFFSHHLFDHHFDDCHMPEDFAEVVKEWSSEQEFQQQQQQQQRKQKRKQEPLHEDERQRSNTAGNVNGTDDNNLGTPESKNSCQSLPTPC